MVISNFISIALNIITAIRIGQRTFFTLIIITAISIVNNFITDRIRQVDGTVDADCRRARHPESKPLGGNHVVVSAFTDRTLDCPVPRTACRNPMTHAFAVEHVPASEAPSPILLETN
jgi:hypothetical protein